MKPNDLRAMAPPAAKASFGFGWIAVQGAVCAAIAFGAYYVFSTPNLMGGSGSSSGPELRPSIAQQTIAVVSRATSPDPLPPPPPPKAAPPPSPAQEAASMVMTFLGRTSPADPAFAACAKVARTDPSKFFQKFVQGDHEAIAKASDCYLSVNTARLCEDGPRRDMLDVLGIYFATKRAHIASEKDQAGKPVLAAARWDTQLDRGVRAKFRNTMNNGIVTPEEIARFRDTEMQDLAKDLKPGKKLCQASGGPAAEAAPAASARPPPKKKSRT